VFRDLKLPVSAPYHVRALKQNYERYGHHHNSYYVTTATVLQYLKDVYPFSEGARVCDLSYRFSNVGEAFQLARQDDSSELIPEFYFLPEMFVGKELPPWANNNPFEFVRLHREALESEYVSAHLHLWIDLVFGCKQKGKKRMQYFNSFNFLCYENAPNLGLVYESEDRKAAEKALSLVGRVPT
jgi:hypothetical protein